MELMQLNLSGKDPSYVFLTDVHYGCAGFDQERFLQMRDRLLASGSYWIGGGDYCDFIPHTDKRFDPLSFRSDVTVRSLGDLFMDQAVGFRDLVLPIRKQCLGLQWGNHDIDACKYFNIVRFLCKELDVPCLSWTVLARLVTDKRKFTLYSSHGSVGKLEYWANKVVKGWDATIYQKGHTHEMGFLSRPRVGLQTDDLHMEAEDQLFLVGGSWKRAYEQGTSSYEERREYPPNPIGNYKITLYDDGEISCRRA